MSNTRRSTDAVVAFITELNELWQAGEVERLADHYHPDVVLLPPDLGDPIVGRDAVTASYRDFLQAATVEAFDVTALDVFPFGEALHVAHLRFTIVYSLDGQRFRESGLEVYTIAGGDPLQIVWRGQSVLESRTLSWR